MNGRGGASTDTCRMLRGAIVVERRYIASQSQTPRRKDDMSTHRQRGPARMLGRAAVLALALGIAPLASAVTPTAADTSTNIPYSLPVQLPSAKSSPSVDAYAPYTPAVLSLIAQLEPSNPPTQAELANADALLHDGA